MARFYSNENFPQGTVEALRQLGHDVLTSHDAGKSRQGVPDMDVLNFAIASGRAVLTLNRKDFKKIHTAVNGQHAGLVLCTQDADFPGQAHRIHDVVHPHDNLRGKLLDRKSVV